MSAEYLSAVCPAPHNSRNEVINIFDTATSSEIMDAIVDRVVTEDALPAINKAIRVLELPERGDDVFTEYLETDEFNGLDLDQAKKFVREELDRLEEDEIIVTLIKGDYYFSTGGMSLGDSPTESFDPIIFIDEARIFEKPINLDGNARKSNATGTTVSYLVTITTDSQAHADQVMNERISYDESLIDPETGEPIEYSLTYTSVS